MRAVMTVGPEEVKYPAGKEPRRDIAVRMMRDVKFLTWDAKEYYGEAHFEVPNAARQQAAVEAAAAAGVEIPVLDDFKGFPMFNVALVDWSACVAAQRDDNGWGGRFYIAGNCWWPPHDGNKTGGVFSHLVLNGKGKKLRWKADMPGFNFADFVPQWFRDLPRVERADQRRR